MMSGGRDWCMFSNVRRFWRRSTMGVLCVGFCQLREHVCLLQEGASFQSFGWSICECECRVSTYSPRFLYVFLSSEPFLEIRTLFFSKGTGEGRIWNLNSKKSRCVQMLTYNIRLYFLVGMRLGEWIASATFKLLYFNSLCSWTFGFSQKEYQNQILHFLICRFFLKFTSKGHLTLGVYRP